MDEPPPQTSPPQSFELPIIPINEKAACSKCNSATIHLNRSTNLWKCYSCTAVFKKPVQRLRFRYRLNYEKRSTLKIVPNNKEMVTEILKVQDLKTKALLAVLYLTGRRISEIVGNDVVAPLTNDRISLAETNEGVKVLLFHNIEILKRKKDVVKDIGVVVSKNPELVNVVLEYANSLPRGGVLFDMSRAMAWKLVSGGTKGRWFPHFMRHATCTNLVREYNLNDGDLTRFICWADSRQAGRYVELNWQDIANKIARTK